MEIRNPVLRGFNPDPSICRVGDDYYIATSTFEWYGGVQIHHSRDLVHWRLLTHPLDRYELLDMRGDSCSGGVWAPCLSYADNRFWLVYTDVKSRSHDHLNYLTTAPAIEGPWSAPVFLNSSGFDPSLFHDSDGRKWLVNMMTDFRKNRNWFGGILLQEYSVAQQRLVGPIQNIFSGSPLGSTEGPHLYKRDGRYYLMTAEGGTSYDHAVLMARSDTIAGPYESDPAGHMLTSAKDPSLELQKAGHASLVETQGHEWYVAHLCGRPVGPDRRCILGRETALQKCVWSDDGWLRLAHGSNTPRTVVPAPNLPAHPFPPEPLRDDFDSPALSVHLSTLRSLPDESWLSLRSRPGFLRLTGRQSWQSQFLQSLVARRVQSIHCEASTRVEFHPTHYQQMAGLTAWYNNAKHYSLLLTHDEKIGTCLYLSAYDSGHYIEPLEGRAVAVPAGKPIYMKVILDAEWMQFSYSLDGRQWHMIGPTLDATKLSDDYPPFCFTGMFVGMCCYDLGGTRQPADFDYLEYRERG
jgi:xylan 1,4-beta-xylosidase